jgi:hypothetical protein
MGTPGNKKESVYSMMLFGSLSYSNWIKPFELNHEYDHQVGFARLVVFCALPVIITKFRTIVVSFPADSEVAYNFA